ncbi:cytochrome c [Reinekea forsetii]|nr:cytochrome c [Reinekea forsetii]
MKFFYTLTLFFAATVVFGDHNQGHVDVSVGKLSPRAAAGQLTFNENCAACHGTNGQGTLIGPPLIHNIYNPGHHPNESFTRAVLKGVQQHHWQYGNMPPQPHIGFSEITNIIAFVREVQANNGITSQEHKM